MIYLYRGTGSQKFSLDGIANVLEWDVMRKTVVEMLNRRKKNRAAHFLEIYQFELYKGKNDFDNEFLILYRRINLEECLLFDNYSRNKQDQECFKDIVQIINELLKIYKTYIRFIVVEPAHTSKQIVVEPPMIKITSAVVEQTLLDAKSAISNGLPVSAVDRTHTALHGYLKQICIDAGLISSNQDYKLNELIKCIRKNHPRFQESGPHYEHTQKILQAMSTIIDALGPIRNRGSHAHPNSSLVDDVDAMLVINATLTILRYFNSKMET